MSARNSLFTAGGLAFRHLADEVVILVHDLIALLYAVVELIYELVSLGHQVFHGFVLLLDAGVGLLQLPLQAFDRRPVFGNLVGQSIDGGLQAIELTLLDRKSVM